MTPMAGAVIRPLILASQSQGRQMLMREAGLSFECVSAVIDEEAVRSGMEAEGAKPRDIADALAQAKALKVSRKFPDAMVIGSDQILVMPDGDLMRKAGSRDEAEIQIAKLAGRTHRLISAAVICEEGKAVWRIVDGAKLTMKPLEASTITAYVKKYWEDIRHCVGCYRAEAEGAALFDNIEGEQSTIVGMPMRPLLDYLTIRGYERAL
ncbi:MAG: Maf family protein [Sphingorhabdus sp.]